MTTPLRAITHEHLMPKFGINYTDRHLRNLEAAGLWPKRIRLNGKAKGGAAAWLEHEIEAHLRSLADARGS